MIVVRRLLLTFDENEPLFPQWIAALGSCYLERQTLATGRSWPSRPPRTYEMVAASYAASLATKSAAHVLVKFSPKDGTKHRPFALLTPKAFLKTDYRRLSAQTAQSP